MKPISIDDLKWSEVTLPDRFDDAEGFFGLEEIEGVEVIRPGGTEEKVQYRVLSLRNGVSDTVIDRH